VFLERGDLPILNIMTITADIADPLICFGTIMHGKTLHFLELERV
jgi:hypothetical protein